LFSFVAKMAETPSNIKRILHDLQTSWYFRIWLLMWIVCAIVTFACLIILGSRSNKGNEHQDIQIWRENATTLNFPQFHIRVGGSESFVILSYQCSYMGTPLQTMACAGQQPSNQCFAVNSSGIAVANNISSPQEESRIECSIFTTNTSGSTLLAFEIEGANVASYGGNSYASVWFSANDRTWVMLEKAFYSASGQVLTLWDRTLLYHSTVSVPGSYNLTVILGSFIVQHWDQVNSYNGWMSTGDVGGFAFFCVIIHTILMAVVGIALDNNSTLLKDKDKDPMQM